MLCVRDAMDETGVDFAMDVHGDEAIPADFLAGFEGIPSWTDAQGEIFHLFAKTLARRTPDFQTEQGYPVARPGGQSVDVDQPARRALRRGVDDAGDAVQGPRADARSDFGWSAERSMRLGADCLGALHEMIGEIGQRG